MDNQGPWQDYQGGFVEGDSNLPNGVTAAPVAQASAQPQAATGPWQDYAAPPQVAPGLDGAPLDKQLVQADQLSPDDTAALQQLYHTGSADDIRQFLHARGRASQPGLDEYIAKRDANPASVTYNPSYAGKQVDDTALGAFARGADQGLTLGFGDEAHGFLNGVTSMLNGGSYTDAYNRTVDSDRALLGQDSQQHGLASFAGNLAGGAVLPFGLAKVGLTPALEAVALKAGQEAVAAGASADAAKVIAARAVVRQMAVEGAGYGGAYGAGSAEGGPGQRLTGAAIGAGEGALGGAALGALGVRSAAKTAAPLTQGQEIGAAAARQGIDLLPADVSGATIKRLTAGTAQTPFGAAPIAAAAQRMADQSQSVRDQVASSIGQALAPEQAGENIRSGALDFIKSSGAAKDAMYRAAENAAGDTRVTPTKALQALNDHISELSEVPGGTDGLSTLQGLQDALSQGDVSVRGMRGMRTALRDKFRQDGLTGSDIERRTNGVLDAARDDITDSLTADGKAQAASLFSRADSAYRQRQDTIDNVLRPIIGTRDKPASGEQIAKNLASDLKGNNARAVKLLNTLPDEERGNARASIIGSMGKVSAGADNPDGTRFSLPAFLTAYNNIGDTAKRAYFGSEGMSALNDLAKVANGTKLAQAYANHSNTGGAIATGHMVTETGRMLTTLSALPTLGGSIGGQFAMGKLLAYPRFARWLARAPRTALSEPSYIERLGRIARAEPAIAGDVLNLQQRLTNAISSAPNRAAAQQPGNGMGVANGQDAQSQPNYQGTAP